MELLQAFHNLTNGVALLAGPTEYRNTYKFENGEIVSYKPHGKTGEMIKMPIHLDRGEILDLDYKNQYNQGFGPLAKVEGYENHPFWKMLEQVTVHVYDAKMTNEKGEVLKFKCFPDSFKILIRLDAEGNQVPVTISREDIDGNWTFEKEED